MPKRDYQSRLLVMLAIWDYLYAKESEIGWVTKYHMRRKTPGRRGQTSKRIAEMRGDVTTIHVFTSKLYLMERTVMFYEFHQNWRNSLERLWRRRNEQT